MSSRKVRHEKPVVRYTKGGKKRYLARYTDAAGKVRSAGTFDRSGAAQDAINAAYGIVPSTATTIRGYLPRWLKEHAVSERTMRTNRGRINALLEVEVNHLKFGEWEIEEVTRRTVKDLIDHMFENQGRAPEGVRGHLRAYSAMWSAAIDDELCETNPWQGHRVREDDSRSLKSRREARIWSFAEMHAFARAAEAPFGDPMIRLMSDNGLRPGEVFALLRSGFDPGQRVLHVLDTAWEGRRVPSSREKNHDRPVPLTDELVEMLSALPVLLGSPLLFPTPGWRVEIDPETKRFRPGAQVGFGKRAGKLWRYSNWKRRLWEPTILRAGIDPAPGEFRHSWVSHMRDAGVNPAAVAAVAGHTVETESRIYTKRVQDRFDELREVVGR